MSLEEEYRSARESVALASAPGGELGKISFAGPDRKKFLHGLLTNDVLGLAPFRGLSACLLTVKGKLTAVCDLYDRGEDLLCLQQAPLTEVILETLSKYLPLSRTTMQDIGSDFKTFLLLGPEADALMKKIFPAFSPLEPYQAALLEWKTRELFVSFGSRLGLRGLLILCPAASSGELEGSFLEAGKAFSLKKAGASVLEIIRVEEGIAAFGQDIGHETIPLEARLEEAVSFSKGCYLGQEVVTRIKDRGHVNKILTGLKLEGQSVPPPESVVFSQSRQVGLLTSAVYSPALGSALALATVSAGEAEPGKNLQVKAGSQEWRAQVVSLPLKK